MCVCLRARACVISEEEDTHIGITLIPRNLVTVENKYTFLIFIIYSIILCTEMYMYSFNFVHFG